MGTTGNVSELIVGLVICLAMLVLFALMAWKYWHGQWLRSIAGNNFVSEEEYGSPEQRKLGKRISLAMIISCSMVAAIPLVGIGRFLGDDLLFSTGSALSAASIAALVIYLVWMFAVMSRERRIAENELIAQDPSKTDDVKLDRSATVVLLVIICVYLFCVLAVPLIVAR